MMDNTNNTNSAINTNTNTDNNKNSNTESQEERCSHSYVQFVRANIMEQQCLSTTNHFLKRLGKQRFDVVFCFSITLWIHVNEGDEGLRTFLRTVSSWTTNLILEPQPWSCYKSCAKRFRKLGLSAPPLLDTINIRSNVEDYISDFLCNECNMKVKTVLGQTQWKRNIVWYTHQNQETEHSL